MSCARDKLVVMIVACQVMDPGSIPGMSAIFFRLSTLQQKVDPFFLRQQSWLLTNRPQIFFKFLFYKDQNLGC